MSESFLRVVATRNDACSDSAADGMVHFLAGVERVPLSAARSSIPHDCFLGEAMHNERPQGPLPLPMCNADFMRQVLRFFTDDIPLPPFAACRYLVLIRHPACGTLDRVDTCEWCKALQQTRVTLFTREGYYEGSPVAVGEIGSGATELPAAAFELRTTAPTVLNEVRVRAVEWDLSPEELDSDGEEWITDRKQRRVPPFVVLGGDDVQSFPPVALVAHDGTAEDMEARALVLRNAPQRRRACGDTLSALLALPREMCWLEADLHGCADLTFSLGRALLEKHSKLKAFLAVRGSRGGVDSSRLKAWPGKDAVQAMAAWWLAARLVEAHAYTEPELYAVIEAECAYPPDLGTIRKELVRRRCLTQPSITENADKTTTTLYRLDADGMQQMLEGEWRSKGVI